MFTLAARVARRGGGSLRVWSCGCSAGHEPYGLALAWECTLARLFPTVSLEVVGTDVSAEALTEAAAATFHCFAVANLPVEWVARCFEVFDDDAPGGGGGGAVYRLRSSVTRHVKFLAATDGDARTAAPRGPPFALVRCCGGGCSVTTLRRRWAARPDRRAARRGLRPGRSL